MYNRQREIFDLHKILLKYILLHTFHLYIVRDLNYPYTYTIGRYTAVNTAMCPLNRVTYLNMQ